MKDIILIAVLMFLYIIVFSMKGNYITYKPLQPQTIFDFETQQNTSFSEKPLFSYLSQQVDLPTYKIYSELYLPEKFIAELTKAKSQADYILVSEKILEQKFVFVKQTQLSHSEQRAQHKILSKNTTKKETKEAKNVEKIEVELETQTIQNIPESTKELNYVRIKNFVSKNQKTYFYPAVSVGKDVVVSIVSYTPYSAEEGILKFKITNNQKSFFFINLFQ
ncbi:MAG: hypothetical protein NZ839_02885, partial [Endomicrobia bacterium]|nr:hypothetical protein [Endomicrobiia bacterium]